MQCYGHPGITRHHQSSWLLFHQLHQRYCLMKGVGLLLAMSTLLQMMVATCDPLAVANPNSRSRCRAGAYRKSTIDHVHRLAVVPDDYLKIIPGTGTLWRLQIGNLLVARGCLLVLVWIRPALIVAFLTQTPSGCSLKFLLDMVS